MRRRSRGTPRMPTVTNAASGSSLETLVRSDSDDSYKTLLLFCHPSHAPTPSPSSQDLKDLAKNIPRNPLRTTFMIFFRANHRRPCLISAYLRSSAAKVFSNRAYREVSAMGALSCTHRQRRISAFVDFPYFYCRDKYQGTASAGPSRPRNIGL